MRRQLIFGLIFFLAMALTCDVLRAHRERFIALDGAKLTGLPEKYAPAEFDRKMFRLRIGNREIDISLYLQVSETTTRLLNIEMSEEARAAIRETIKTLK